ncbi:GNAT family N-acetyltransferase [Amycolatopsis azurea]|uniref:N-acetyltransferase n=1 Tax=Amycolatopsis azurea DSM 43854 TaxID=1238180 RepID=M2NK43_9PSEU|nr:GNAT family protein [Amycolatopsis azurea]EMD22504.1 putative acetyltransferase [Amycolatopsis azurea DSM 43854]OOC08388.1 N-acetyltransferase [Amycolatopsis azurea DSM 43854]
MTDWNTHATLTGERVRLEPLTRDHAKGLFEAGSDPAIWTWLSLRQPSDLAAAEAMVDGILADPGRRAWAQLDARTGEVAGTTSFYAMDAHHKIISLGYTWIGSAWQRTGLNRESKLLLLRHAFDDLGANRVSWETDIHNLKSQKAIERLGAQREGVLRAHRVRPDGTVRDTVVYSVTGPEWPAVRTALSSSV